jgi:hypothetical protein
VGFAACATPETINAKTNAVAATARFIEILSASYMLGQYLFKPNRWPRPWLGLATARLAN